MITYVKANNTFIWGRPVNGLPIETIGRVQVQHDGDEIGAREIARELRLSPKRKYFLLALRPLLSEIFRALSFAPEPERIEAKKRAPQFKFRLFGSAEEAYKRFLAGDYRYILRKYDERNYKHRVAYVKAFLMAAQNPFLLPSEEKMTGFIDLIREIDDSLLQGFYEEIRTFIRGSGTLLSVHNYVATHEADIVKAIKDEETAALWSYEVGSVEVAKQLMNFAKGIRYKLAESTLIIYGGFGSIPEGFARLASPDPNEVVVGFLMIMERLHEAEIEERLEGMHNLHVAFDARLEALKDPNLALPSYVARSPITGKSDLLVQYLRAVPEALSDLKEAMRVITLYAESTPKEIRAHVAHDLALPYLYVRNDPATVLKLYKAIGQAATNPPERVLLLPLFVAATDYDYDLKYPMERLLISAKENELYLDAALGLKKALEVNHGVVREYLEDRREEIRGLAEIGVIELA